MTPPRACPFCQSRHLVNQEIAGMNGQYAVECLFCHAIGPVRLIQDEAWLAWNGDLLRASAGFGSPESLVGG